MIIETEVLGFTIRGVPFDYFPGWLQLATGLPIVLGVLLAFAAMFVAASPENIEEGGTRTRAADKMAETGLLVALGGLVSILVAALMMPHTM